MKYRDWTINVYRQRHPQFPAFVATAWRGGEMFNVEADTPAAAFSQAKERIDKRG